MSLLVDVQQLSRIGLNEDIFRSKIATIQRDATAEDIDNAIRTVFKQSQSNDIKLKFTRRGIETVLPISWLIQGLVPPGLTLIYGDSQVGKSWLALQMAKAIATGESFLGMTVPEKRKVLYVAFEGDRSAFMKRVEQVFNGPYPETFEPLCPLLEERDDAEKRLEGEIENGLGALFIDWLGNVAEVGSSRYKMAARRLGNLAWEYHAAGIWLEHTLKGKPRIIKGGTDVTGLADSKINVLRRQDAEKGTLEIHGRVHPKPLSLDLRFDKTPGKVPWYLPMEQVKIVKP
jgi:hypothetical protein